MLKKRVIFTLLYDNGNFHLSRNFRLQRVGNVDWLKHNYNFSEIAYAIDELLILDVSRGPTDFDGFCEAIQLIVEEVFVPVAAGGGIRSVNQARQILRSGADKIVLNTVLFDDDSVVKEIVSSFGRQAIVGSVDYKTTGIDDNLAVFVENGSRQLELSFAQVIDRLLSIPIGELYLNSIDRDGTGFGYDIGVLEKIPSNFNIPLILAGGAGNGYHLEEGLANNAVDAVATAHLFNFIGDGLALARQQLITNGIQLPQ